MSQENVEIVRRFLGETEVKSGEWPTIVAEFWDADSDYYPVRKFPDAMPRHGREAVTRWLVQFYETWDRYESPVRKLVSSRPTTTTTGSWPSKPWGWRSRAPAISSARRNSGANDVGHHATARRWRECSRRRASYRALRSACSSS